jgi:transposase
MVSEVSAQFLQAILDSEPNVPVVVFWDRAPWHRGEEVKKLLDSNPRLQIIFFPTASPDLNPQEHVWKAARKAISHNHTTSSLPELADRFEEFLTNTAFPISFLDCFGYTAIYPMCI